MSGPITINGIDIGAYHGPNRRAFDGHTPEDCNQLLGAMAAMKNIHERLDDGSSRMGRIEQSVAEVKAALEASHKATEEYRQKTDAGIKDVHDKLAASEVQSALHRKRLEGKLDENTTATLQNATNNTRILDILTLGENFFRLAGYFGTFAKWVAGLAIAWFSLSSAWDAWFHGRAPP